MNLRRSISAALLLLISLIGCTRDPEARKHVFLDTGDRYLEKGEYKTASLVYRKAIQIDGRFGEAYYGLGVAELKAGRFGPAIRALQRACSLMPGHRDAFTRLAGVYLAVSTANQNVRASVKAMQETCRQIMEERSIQTVEDRVAFGQRERKRIIAEDVEGKAE